MDASGIERVPPRPDLVARSEAAQAGREGHACANCGRPLSRMRRWLGKYLCEQCEDAREAQDREAAQQQRAAQEATHGSYQTLLEEVARGAPAAPLLDQLRQTAPLTGLSEKDLQKMNADALERRLGETVADEIVTPEEEEGVATLLSGLGLAWGDVTAHHPEFGTQFLIGMANAGRLPAATDSQLMTKRGEVVHLEQRASLMKEVTKRQYVGGYSGWSFPIGKTGIRYRVGGMRGHSEVVGTELQIADQGTLVISSQRAVFIGGKSTIEMPYAKLVGVQVFTDGIRFNLSNRQRAPLFKLPSGDVVAAFIHTAMQSL